MKTQDTQTASCRPIHTPGAPQRLVDEDTHRPFLRTTCKKCDQWIGDQLIPQ